MKFSSLLVLFLVSAPGFAQIFTPQAVDSVAEARSTRAGRTRSIVEHYARQPLAPPPVMPKKGFAEFAMTMLARLEARTDLEAVSQNLLTDSFRPWNSGTEIAVAGTLCKREGDYDFVLMGLVRMAYLDLESGERLLTPAARRKLRHVLLSEKGTKHHVHFRLKNCLPVKIKDSENHIMMTEFARYLTNQLLFAETGDAQFDNAKNGFEEWLLEHLAEFLRTDFDELNSRPYQGYTLIALATLADYAQGARVRDLARMILDYLSAKAAIQSKGLRRLSPFRRQLRHRDLRNLMQTDNAMFWYAFHAGNAEFVGLQRETPDDDPAREQSFFSDYMYFMAALDRYEIPAPIHALFFDQRVAFFQKLRARDVEIYHHSRSFLLSAGGRYRKVFGYFTRENDVWAMPTSIIPKGAGITLADLFVLHGDEKWKKKNNLCVAPGFACGKHLSVPAHLPDSCVERAGPWSFFDMKKCTGKEDFFVATYQDGENALWEVREAEVAFSEFKARILTQNPGAFGPKGDHTFVTSDGRAIVFTWSPKNLNTYPIKRIGAEVIETDTTKWPFAAGNVINSTGDGLVRIHNPVSNEAVELDHRNVLRPKRVLNSERLP